MKQQTRERWLRDLTDQLDTTLFDKQMPTYRITCGFPSRGGLAAKQKVLGQCWNPNASEDNTTEIIMTITTADTMEIAATVAHEMVHAIVGVEHGHRKPFRDVALAIHLEGKMTATTPSKAFKDIVQPILDKLPKYPHAKLNGATLPKQTTRMIKATCSECGYITRTSRKWIEQAGAPLCPQHKTQMGEQ